ncbi:MAG: DNA-formamidopyrimidine glycosylase family protein [Candidatus Nanopelagicales bacterium]
MPEGDTVLRTARRLHQALAGRALLAADLRWPGLSTAALAGMVVTEVTARGKHLLTRFDTGWTLHSHLRMEGSWVIRRTSEGTQLPLVSERSSVRAILVGPEWTALGLRLGMLDLVRTEEEHQLVGHLGPDVLGPGFDVERAAANLAASDTSIGAALLDQRNLAGIGTLWASETLFAEHLHPLDPAAQLDQRALAAVVASARRLMIANLDHAVQSSTGSRRPGRETYVHGRSRRPCLRCGAIVNVVLVGPVTQERQLCYCPGCQPRLAPGSAPLAP